MSDPAHLSDHLARQALDRAIAGLDATAEGGRDNRPFGMARLFTAICDDAHDRYGISAPAQFAALETALDALIQDRCATPEIGLETARHLAASLIAAGEKRLPDPQPPTTRGLDPARRADSCGLDPARNKDSCGPDPAGRKNGGLDPARQQRPAARLFQLFDLFNPCAIASAQLQAGAAKPSGDAA